jgi:hypothetical protein
MLNFYPARDNDQLMMRGVAKIALDTTVPSSPILPWIDNAAKSALCDAKRVKQ